MPQQAPTLLNHSIKIFYFRYFDCLQYTILSSRKITFIFSCVASSEPEWRRGGEEGYREQY